MKNRVLKYYIVAFCFCSTLSLLAQNDEGDGNGGIEGPDAPAAPIDNYLWVMALIGIIYVFFKYKTFKRENAETKADNKI